MGCSVLLQIMATDFDFILKADGWTPPTTTSQASMRILRAKDGRQFIGKYSNSKAKQVQKTLQMLLAPHKPGRPVDGALSVEITYRLPYRKTEKKSNLANEWMPHDTRPDADNLLKLLLDSMNKVFWHDDAQISHLSIFKQRGHDPHIRIKIRQI